jgi:hypothetical protein
MITDVCLRIACESTHWPEIQDNFRQGQFDNCTEGEPVIPEKAFDGVSTWPHTFLLIKPPIATDNVSKGIQWIVERLESGKDLLSEFRGEMDIRISFASVTPDLHYLVLTPPHLRVCAELEISIHCTYWMPAVSN